MNYEKMMEKARRVNAKRDKAERKAGFSTPDEGPLSIQIGTAMSAIKAGIRMDDWNCVAEGQAMLEKLAAKADAFEKELAGKEAPGIYTKRKMKPEEIFERMAKVYLGSGYYLINPKADKS